MFVSAFRHWCVCNSVLSCDEEPKEINRQTDSDLPPAAILYIVVVVVVTVLKKPKTLNIANRLFIG